jgi:CRISPR-associated protein Cas1
MMPEKSDSGTSDPEETNQESRSDSAGGGHEAGRTPGPRGDGPGSEHPREDPTDLLPARMLNEFTYCPRLFYLEYVQSEFTDNLETVEGRFAHRRVDQTAGKVPTPETVSDDDPGKRATSVMLSAPELGAVARMDLLELEGRTAVPVDYKRGSKPDVPEGAYEPERVQLCLQGLILRENGYVCDHGEIYYAESKERVPIPFDEALVERTVKLLTEARKAAATPKIPPPLVDSPKCPRCSLVGICLPDETNFLSRTRSISLDSVRRLVPSRDEASPLYLQAQGIYLGKSGETIQIKEKGEKIRDVRMIDVSQVNLLGNIQVSTQLIHELCRRDAPLCYFSYGGWFLGMTGGLGHKNVELRQAQFAAAGDQEKALQLSKQFVRGKILNSRTILRRNHKDIPEGVLKELARLAHAAARANEIPTLLGLEGAAARLYFGHFGELLRGEEKESLPAFDFDGRNRRPPRDPVNCLLSFAYAMLTKDLTITSRAVGLDPFLGFFHQPRYGRPALALDLMEELRPIVADSVVLQLVNNGEIRVGDFILRAGGCTLTGGGRRRVISAYERRMDSTVTHPLFRYSVSYRRVLEIQTRLLARYLTGEIPEYPPFRTR